MKKVWQFLNDYFEESIMVVLLVVITVLLFMQVIMRYIFHNALAWPEELSRYCFVISGMLSAGYCVRNNRSFRVDVFFQFFPKPIKWFIDLASKLLVMALYAYMAYMSIDLIRTTTTLSTALRIPVKYIYMSITIAMIADQCGQDVVDMMYAAKEALQ